MKRLVYTLLALLALCFTAKAQQYVSTAPANRNVIIEEFTGRNCQFCPDGHRIANEIMAEFPGRVWAINVHGGGYAPDSYPNFKTADGNTILGGFQISGYPTGVVNRSTPAGQSRSTWRNLSINQMNQAAECNVGGMVLLNPATRTAEITVEVYYTGSNAVNQNYLTIAMLQDSIWGSQVGGSSNPAQWVNGQYCHMHILRDIITSSAWGDPISPTSAGTLITKTYTYQIPQSIGNPGGVEVVLDHIFFLAWVDERSQGYDWTNPNDGQTYHYNAYRPILNGCELEMVIGSNEPIYPMVAGMNVEKENSCTQERRVEVTVSNIGMDTLTSMVVSATLEGVTQTANWTGSMPRFGSAVVEVPMEVPFGNHTVTASVVEANGVAVQNATSSCPVECPEWVDLPIEGETEQIKLMLVQDKWGSQITWEFTLSNGEVIASGGPYNNLTGNSTTLPHAINVTLPVNECVQFTIHDSGQNGICCNDGNGYYKVFDSKNHLIIDGDGAFGAEVTHSISVKDANAVELVAVTPQILGYHEATFVSQITGNCQEVGFEYKKLTDATYMSVVAVLEGNTFSATVNNLEMNTDYVVRPYAVVGGSRIYGEEVRFHTWVEGVGELSQSLKVYPNPAGEYLYVEGGMTSLEVYNALGQRLLSQQVTGHAKIDLSDYTPGIYFLRVSNNGETLVKKFSVNR